MREQKKIICWSAGITILSLALSTVLEYELDRHFIVWPMNCFTGHRDFIINILTGVCTGAFLSLFIALINYSAEKEKFIMEFSNLVEDFYTVCNHLQYLYLRGDVDLLAAYYQEKYMNQKVRGATKKHIAQDKLLRSYKEKDPNCNVYICLAKDEDVIDDELDTILKSYGCVEQFDFSRIERTLKRKDFIIQNGKKEKQIESIYNYIKKLYYDIKGKVGYWNEFCSENHLIVEIYRFQSQIFGKIKRSGSVVFLPPDNIAVEEIRKMLSALN